MKLKVFGITPKNQPALLFRNMKNNAVDIVLYYNAAKTAWIAVKSGKSPGVGQISAY